MDQKSMLIVGANGQLGKALQVKYPGARTVDRDSLDITNSKSINNFGWENIHVVLNAAAYTNVDEAETVEGRIAAWKVNARGAANLLQAVLKSNLTIVHISTDYVFDGSQEIHTEEEPFSPLSVYGQSKAAGDIIVSLAPKHYILRTSWVIGDGPNFVRTMLGLGQKGVTPRVVSDQIGRLTFTDELVRAVDHLLTGQAAYGTYNASNSGDPSSWADITREIFKDAGYDLNVTNTTTGEYFASKPDAAPRPLYSTLALDKLQASGFTSLDWKENLKTYVAKELGK